MTLLSIVIHCQECAGVCTERCNALWRVEVLLWIGDCWFVEDRAWALTVAIGAACSRKQWDPALNYPREQCGYPKAAEPPSFSIGRGRRVSFRIRPSQSLRAANSRTVFYEMNRISRATCDVIHFLVVAHRHPSKATEFAACRISLVTCQVSVHSDNNLRAENFA